MWRAACYWGCWSLTNQTHWKPERDSRMVRRKSLVQIKREKPLVENMSGRSNPLKQSTAAHPTLKELTMGRAVSSALAVLCGMLYNLPARLRWHGHCLEERIELWCVKGVWMRLWRKDPSNMREMGKVRGSAPTVTLTCTHTQKRCKYRMHT